jgi:two-component system phosphate regulon sensor histidine kinase PhoR
MNQLGVQRRLMAAFLTLLACALAPGALMLSSRVAADLAETMRDSLEREARALSAELERTPPGDLDGWTHALAHPPTRITLIGPEGTVLADSDVRADDLPHVENHAGRPEVAAALHGHTGSAIRRSATIGRDLLYVAVPASPGSGVAVVRLALPMVQVDNAVGRARSALWLAGLVALAVAVMLGAVGARWLSRPLQAMAKAARSMSRGDFAVELPEGREDELGELAHALDTLRRELAGRIADLRRESEKLRTILDGMSEGVALVQDGTIAVANPAFAKLLSLGGRVEGLTPLEATRSPELATVLQRAHDERKTAQREVLVGPRALVLQASPLGAPGQAVVVVIDLTESKRLERLRRDFVANASHELRTPVAAIVGAAETLSAGAADDPGARASFVDILLRHANRLSRLTADLLDIARLEAGYKPRVEEVQVGATFETVLATLKPRADEKQIALSSDGGGEMKLQAEKAAVEQILTNLVDNAIKYTPAGGKVKVTAERAGALVRLIVQDTGPGVAPEHQQRLWERFYRVDAARSRELGGTGLGLSIVKHLALAHGGDARVESQLGKGSRFIVSLPAA